MAESALGGAMDSRQFDDLARSVAEGTSRRGVIQGLVVGIAGTGLGLGFADDADAKKVCKGREGRRKCRDRGENHKCCGNRRKKCVNTNNSEKHCGRCDRRCGNDEVCISGECVQVS
jgi:hypothetical protein